MKIGNVGAADVFWASCATCRWWSDDRPGAHGYTTRERADELAREHNRVFHAEVGPLITCGHEDCGHRFFFVPARRHPELCLDHAAVA